MADTLLDLETLTLPLISRDLADFGRPGVWVEVDPDTAEKMGAFHDTCRVAPCRAR